MIRPCPNFHHHRNQFSRLHPLNEYSPSITNPAKFLLVCWSLLLLGIIYTVNRATFSAWQEKTRALWLATGFLVIAIIVIGGLYILNNWLLGTTGINNLLRGSLDYRELAFYEDGQPSPSASEFWAEQSQTRVRWSPYTYWLVDEFHGRFINIGADGIRATANYGEGASLYVFGGSTVWGEGARDNYTIPSHLARLFNEAGNPRTVVNYGQTGYVSSQDLIWFQLQLLRGNLPETAIFYQGINDVLSAWGYADVGVTLQEDYCVLVSPFYAYQTTPLTALICPKQPLLPLRPQPLPNVG